MGAASGMIRICPVGLESVCITSDIVVININRGICSKLSIMTLKEVGRYGNDPHKATCDQ